MFCICSTIRTFIAPHTFQATFNAPFFIPRPRGFSVALFDFYESYFPCCRGSGDTTNILRFIPFMPTLVEHDPYDQRPLVETAARLYQFRFCGSECFIQCALARSPASLNRQTKPIKIAWSISGLTEHSRILSFVYAFLAATISLLNVKKHSCYQRCMSTSLCVCGDRL